MSLRLRLLLAFALVALPPLAVLSAALASRTRVLAEEATRDDLASGVRAVADRLDRERLQASDRLALASREAALDAASDDAIADLAATLAEATGLELVELVADGVRLGSYHWAAGLGLPDDDRPFGDGSLRVETVADGFTRRDRLAVTAQRPLILAGRRVTLRGGTFVDGSWLDEAAALLDARLGWYDVERRRWYVTPGSPLESWEEPPLQARAGVARLQGEDHLWQARPVAPGLLLVGAISRAPLARLLVEQRRLALGVGAGAILAAALGALWLAGRLSRPVSDLVDHVTRLAAGDPTPGLPTQPWEELDELARAFDATAQELRSSSGRLRQVERVAEWREMARRLAHELKNPLFPMQLSVETLRRAWERSPAGADPELGPLVRESSDAVLGQIRALKDVVEAFSAFARMPRPRPEAVDVGALLQRVAGLQRTRAGSVRVDVEVPDPAPGLRADPSLLERALGNLVSNALDALSGRDEGRIVLRAFTRPGLVCLEVEDDGPGLDAEQQARVFTPYYTSRRGGTGLGLPIVQAIAADHGGRVDVDSSPGAGARFTLRLPTTGQSTPPA